MYIQRGIFIANLVFWNPFKTWTKMNFGFEILH